MAEVKKERHYSEKELHAIAMKLDRAEARTSFGRLPLSNERSAENRSFQKAARDKGANLYEENLSKIANIGKHSPGPVYEYKDTIKYKKVSIFHR